MRSSARHAPEQQSSTPSETRRVDASLESALRGVVAGYAPQVCNLEVTFGPFREKRKQLAADPGYVEDVLRDGAQRARAEAQTTMELVRQRTGLR